MSTSNIQIRLASPEDADAIAHTMFRSHTISFANYASEEWVASRKLSDYEKRWQEHMADDSPDVATFVAELNNRVVGSVRLSPIHSDKFDAQLGAMHVDPDMTGHGIGSLLMDRALQFISERGFNSVNLGVIKANTGARRFYEANGWAVHEEFPTGIEGVPVMVYSLVNNPYA